MISTTGQKGKDKAIRITDRIYRILKDRKIFGWNETLKMNEIKETG